MEWIAAGFPPGDFWGQTPRAILRALKGAGRARRRRLSDMALASRAARLPGDDFGRFLDSLDQDPDAPRAALPPEALPMLLQSMDARLAVISMDDALAKMGRRPKTRERSR